MSRLPVPGQDAGTWGDVLNDYLLQAHAADGTLKPGVVGSSQLIAGSVTATTIADGTITEAQLALPLQTKINGSAADTTATSKGLIQLAGDLAGTAAAPTVPGLATKEPSIAAGTTSQYWRGDKSWQPLTAEAASAARWLVPTVQTTTYSAAASDMVIADATSAAFTVTLPAAPVDKTRIAAKKIDSTGNVVTIQAGNGAVFNKAGGITSLVLGLQNQAVSLQYTSSTGIWYVVADDLPLTQLDARYQTASQLRRPLNNTFVVIGDSILSGYDMYFDPTSRQGYFPWWQGGFYHRLSVESFGRMQYGGYYAGNGYTLGQTLSTLLPQVLALNPAPGACIVEAGVCDAHFGPVPFSTSVANLKSIVTQLLAAKILPILCTVGPDELAGAPSTAEAQIRKWNTWIRRYAMQQGLPLMDMYTPSTGTNGQWIPANTIDGINPSLLGHASIATQALADGLAEIFNPQGTAGLTSKASSDLANLFGSGSLNYGVFTTNSSGLGAGLSQTGTGTASIVAPGTSDQLNGNWQQYARVAGQSGFGILSFTVPSGWSVGDTIAFSCRIQTNNLTNSGAYLWASITQGIPGGYVSPVGTKTAMYAGIMNWTIDIVDGLFY